MAYSADKGAKLWEVKVGTGVIASPVTYEIDGVQYVSIMAGWGGAFPLTGGQIGLPATPGRLLTFTLNATRKLPEAMAAGMPDVTPIESNASTETIAAGAVLFAENCAMCHGLAALGGGGVLPDLRFSQPSVLNNIQKIVLDGALADEGMPSFKQWLKPEDVEAIRAYIISRRAASAPKK